MVGYKLNMDFRIFNVPTLQKPNPPALSQGRKNNTYEIGSAYSLNKECIFSIVLYAQLDLFDSDVYTLTHSDLSYTL